MTDFNKLCIVITTCSSYYPNLENLMKRIDEIDPYFSFPRKNIMFVSGQEPHESFEFKNGYTFQKVRYTCMHLTGLVHVVNNVDIYRNYYDYFFFVPCTIGLGDTFFELLRDLFKNTIQKSNSVSFPLICPRIRPTMDIGFLHVTCLTHPKLVSFLKKRTLYKFTRNDLIQLKGKLVTFENYIFGYKFWKKNELERNLYHIIPFRKHEKHVIENIVNVGKRKLNQVYFKPLDFYKYQRNYLGFSVPFVIDL